MMNMRYPGPAPVERGFPAQMPDHFKRRGPQGPPGQRPFVGRPVMGPMPQLPPNMFPVEQRAGMVGAAMPPMRPPMGPFAGAPDRFEQQLGPPMHPNAMAMAGLPQHSPAQFLGGGANPLQELLIRRLLGALGGRTAPDPSWAMPPMGQAPGSYY